MPTAATHSKQTSSLLDTVRQAAAILKSRDAAAFDKTARYLGAYAKMLSNQQATVSADQLVNDALDTERFFESLKTAKGQQKEVIDLDITYRRFLKKPTPPPEAKKRRTRKDALFNFNKQSYPQAPRMLEALRRGDEKAASKILNRLPADNRGYLIDKVLEQAVKQNLPDACRWLMVRGWGDFWHFDSNIKTICRKGSLECLTAVMDLASPSGLQLLIERGDAFNWLEASFENKDPRVCAWLIGHFPAKQLPEFRLVDGMLKALRDDNEEVAMILIKQAIKRRLKLNGESIWRLENEILSNRHEHFGALYASWFKQTFDIVPNRLLGRALEFNCAGLASTIMNAVGDSNILLFEEDHDKLATALNSVEKWRRLHGITPPSGLGFYDAMYYRPKLIKTITTLFRNHEHNIFGWAANIMAFNGAGLFETPERLAKYIKRWGNNTETQPLHDLLQMIKLPDTTNPATNIRAWADAVIECGPAMAKLVAFADRVPCPARSADGRSWSLNATRAACAEFAYARGAENTALATLCITNGITEERFDKALDLLNRTKHANANIPDISIDGAQFGMPQHRFYKLADNDIRGLFLGELTGCCQSIGAHGNDCATHGFASPDGGFYVIENNRANIVGQCWAWRGDAGELCFDSLERLGDKVSDDQWLSLLKAFAHELEKQKSTHDVSALHVGLGGKTPKNLSQHFSAKAASPRDYTGYRDSTYQVQVCDFSAPPARADGRGLRRAAPSGAG